MATRNPPEGRSSRAILWAGRIRSEPFFTAHKHSKPATKTFTNASNSNTYWNRKPNIAINSVVALARNAYSKAMPRYASTIPSWCVCAGAWGVGSWFVLVVFLVFLFGRANNSIVDIHTCFDRGLCAWTKLVALKEASWLERSGCAWRKLVCLKQADDQRCIWVLKLFTPFLRFFLQNFLLISVLVFCLQQTLNLETLFEYFVASLKA